MTSFFQLRVKYHTSDGSVFVEYKTVLAKTKHELDEKVTECRNNHRTKAVGDIQIEIKDAQLQW